MITVLPVSGPTGNPVVIVVLNTFSTVPDVIGRREHLPYRDAERNSMTKMLIVESCMAGTIMRRS